MLPDVAFCTPWQRFDYAVIDPGQVRSMPTAGDSVEWGCLVLEGRVEIEAGAALGTGVGTGFVMGPVSAKCEVEKRRRSNGPCVVRRSSDRRGR